MIKKLETWKGKRYYTRFSESNLFFVKICAIMSRWSIHSSDFVADGFLLKIFFKLFCVSDERALMKEDAKL